jgi:hypothetical protein
VTHTLLPEPQATSLADRERIIQCIVANDENGYTTRTQDLFHNAAEQMSVHTPTSVRSHDDKIGFKRLRCLQDRAWDACPVRIDYLRYSTHFAQRAKLARVVELLLRRFLRGNVGRFGLDNTEHGVENRQDMPNDTRHHDSRINRVRQLERIFEGEMRAMATVESRENSFVHDSPPIDGYS